MRTSVLGSLLVSLALLGCGANRELMVRQDEAPMPTQDEALIVFLTPAGPWDVKRITIHDVTTSDPKFVGFSESNSRLSYRAKPGKYTFMVFFVQADFLEATVAAGKTYYVVVSKDIPHGTASVMNRYSLRAVKGRDLFDLDFVRLNRDATPMSKSQRAEEWAAARTSEYRGRKEKYWPNWLARSSEERAPFTLQATDGR